MFNDDDDDDVTRWFFKNYVKSYFQKSILNLKIKEFARQKLNFLFYSNVMSFLDYLLNKIMSYYSIK